MIKLNKIPEEILNKDLYEDWSSDEPKMITLKEEIFIQLEGEDLEHVDLTLIENGGIAELKIWSKTFVAALAYGAIDDEMLIVMKRNYE